MLNNFFRDFNTFLELKDVENIMGIRPELYAEETDTGMVLPVTKSLCEPTEIASY